MKQQKILSALAIVMMSGWAGLAIAGIIFVPVGGRVFENVDLAPVRVQDNGSGSAAIRTTGLTGRLTEAPCATGPAGSFVGLTQQQELLLSPDSNALQGRARGTLTLSVTGEQLRYQGDITGGAGCVARSGDTCSQLVVTLKLDGVISDPTDSGRVGLIRMEQLGSLVRDGQRARWVALDANVTLGGSEVFIGRVLNSMGAGESCVD